MGAVPTALFFVAMMLSQVQMGKSIGDLQTMLLAGVLTTLQPVTIGIALRRYKKAALQDLAARRADEWLIFVREGQIAQLRGCEIFLQRNIAHLIAQFEVEKQALEDVRREREAFSMRAALLEYEIVQLGHQFEVEKAELKEIREERETELRTLGFLQAIRQGAALKEYVDKPRNRLRVVSDN
ncbi:hypothetical protein [Streptomyces sp. NPDC007264]|uniref:hypothetical protein n=1 Tax=Streptomyces sp. NPDC007264 TaxID=3364777 RepID=UPI0036DCEBFC